jgi:hypothetical protein
MLTRSESHKLRANEASVTQVRIHPSTHREDIPREAICHTCLKVTPRRSYIAGASPHSEVSPKQSTGRWGMWPLRLRGDNYGMLGRRGTYRHRVGSADGVCWNNLQKNARRESHCAGSDGVSWLLGRGDGRMLICSTACKRCWVE